MCDRIYQGYLSISYCNYWLLCGGQRWNWTTDTRIFSPWIYHYL